MDSSEKEADLKTEDVKPTLEFSTEDPPRTSPQPGSGNKNGNASTNKSGSKEGNIRKKSNDSTNQSGNNSQGSTGGGSAESKKSKTQKEAVNRLYKPTAASEAKSKHATQGRGQKFLPATSMKPPPSAMRRGVAVRPPPRGGGRGSPPVGRGQTGARGRVRATSRPLENVEIEDGRRERTPDSVAQLPVRGSSTPTGDPASLTELEAWDASHIVTVNKTISTGNMLEETIVAPPRQALPFIKPAVRGGGLNRTMAAGGGGGARQPRTATKRPQTAVKTARKATTANSREGNVILQNTVLEDPEEITEEMLEIAWCRYIQSEYIKRMSKKALEQAEKECERKLVSAWKLLEQTRQEVLKLEEDLILVNIVSDIQDMLEQVGDLLGGEKETREGLLGNLQETGGLLTQLSNGLEAVKHNIEVKGVEIDSQERQDTARRLLQLFSDFTAGTPDLAQLVDQETLQRMQEVERYRELGGGLQRRCKENSDMLNACRTLAVKEASLSLSLKDLAVSSGQPTDTAKGHHAAEGQEPPSLDLPPPILEQPLIDASTVVQSSSAAAL